MVQGRSRSWPLVKMNYGITSHPEENHSKPDRCGEDEGIRIADKFCRVKKLSAIGIMVGMVVPMRRVINNLLQLIEQLTHFGNDAKR